MNDRLAPVLPPSSPPSSIARRPTHATVGSLCLAIYTAALLLGGIPHARAQIAPQTTATTAAPANPTDDPPPVKGTNAVVTSTNAATSGTNAMQAGSNGELSKLEDVVFVVVGDHVKAVPVKIGVADDNYWEITSGLTNGEEIVSGGYRAISRDLKDGARIKKGTPAAEAEK